MTHIQEYTGTPTHARNDSTRNKDIKNCQSRQSKVYAGSLRTFHFERKKIIYFLSKPITRRKKASAAATTITFKRKKRKQISI